MKYIAAASAAFLTATILSGVASAAPAPGPTSADPSRISEKLTQKKAVPMATDEALIKSDDQQLSAAEADKIRFVLKSVKIKGNSVFTTEELSEFYKDKIGKDVSLSEMYTVRDAITKHYREAGYILSRAVVPKQRFTKGGADFQIEIIEGYINDVKIEGEIKGDQDLINSYVAKLKSGGPVNSNNLERYLLLINDLAGTDASAVLKASKAGRGATDVIIDFTHTYVDGTVIFDNSGSKFIGEYMASGQLNANSVFGLSEKFSFRAIATPTEDELRFGDLTYEMPIGTEGTKLRANYGHTQTKPGSTLASLDIEGISNHFELEVTHPFIRTRRENLSGRITFTTDDTKTKSAGAEVYDDSTRVVTLGGTYDLADSWQGVNLLDLSVSRGLPILDATEAGDLRSRGKGDASFTRFNLEANRLQEITTYLDILVAVEGQYASDALLAGEEFGIGGSDFGRGYDFSEITGDHGVAAKLELQYGIPIGYDYLGGIQLYSFFDAGTVWQRDALPAEDERTSMTSVGLGSRFTFIESVAGYAELSKPLNKDIAAYGDKDLQFHFGLSYLF